MPAFTDSRVEPENDTKAKPEMTDGFDTGPSRASGTGIRMHEGRFCLGMVGARCSGRQLSSYEDCRVGARQ